MDQPFQDPSHRLRPMDLRDILDETFDLYKNNFILFAGIAAVIYLPFQLLWTLMAGSLIPPSLNGGFDPAHFAIAPAHLEMAQLLWYIMVMLAFGIFLTLFHYLSIGALSIAVSERYLNQIITIKESYRAIARRFGSLIGTLTLATLGLLGAECVLVLLLVISFGLAALLSVIGYLLWGLLLVAALLVGFALCFGFAFVLPVFAIEGQSGPNALRRSIQLFLFKPFKTLFSLVAVGILILLIMAILMTPIGFLAAMSAPNNQTPSVFVLGLEGALSGVTQSCIEPIMLIVLILLYYDVRIRREGFDLEMMAKELGHSLPGVGTPQWETAEDIEAPGSEYSS